MKKYFAFLLILFSSSAAFCKADSAALELKNKGILAFNDHFYTVASNYFVRYREKTRHENPEYAEASVLLVRSLVQEKRYTDASNVLKDYSTRLLALDKRNLQQELDYWTGYIALTQKKHKDAEAVFRRIIADAVEVDLRIKALTSLAESAFVQKKYGVAKEFYLKLVSKYDRAVEGQNAAGELVKLFLLERDFFWAEREIKRMAASASLISQTNAEALKILYYSLKGDEKNALKQFNSFVQTNRRKKRSNNVFLASFYLGELLDGKKMYNDAASVYASALVYATTSPQTEQAMLKAASARIKAGDVEKAISILSDYLKTFSDSSRKGEVVFTLGGLYKKSKDNKTALKYFEQVVAMDKQTTDMRFKAQMEIADCYILSGDSNNAISAFLAAKKLAEKDNDKAKPIFLAAEEAYRVKKYIQAARYYQLVADEHSKSSYAEHARFYQGLAFVKEKQFSNAASSFQVFLREYPSSTLLPAVLFQQAIALKKQKKYAEAITFFDKLTKQYPGSRNVLQAILLQSECLTSSNKLSEAVALLQNALLKYPKEEMHPYVFSRLINLLFITGDSKKAIAIADEFIKKYGKTDLAPEVFCRLADFYFNSKNYRRATDYYTRLSQEFPKDKRAPQAQLDAAKATAEFSADGAVKLLVAIRENQGLDEKIKAQAAFEHGSILAAQAKYKEAAELFEVVLQYKDVPLSLFQKAAGRKGDCLFLNNQPAEAAAAYGALLKNEALLPELGDQVRFKLAESLIALKKQDDATAILHDIVYQHSAEIRNGKMRDWDYFSRAVFTLADVFVTKGEYEKAVKVLKRISNLKLPVAKEAANRIASLQEKMRTGDK